MASGGDLIYADTEGGGVVIATYPDLKLVGTFDINYATDTFGVCSDASGNVFITGLNYPSGFINEYSHGGTSPIAILSETRYYTPYDCSYDPITGNLAVADYCRACGNYGEGGVSIYANEQGSPTRYTDPNMEFPQYLGYDGKGNVFVGGQNTQTGQTVFAELPKGSSTFANITLPDGVCCAGRIQWDGKHIAIEERFVHAIYRIAVTGSDGSVVGTTRLKERSHYRMGESWLYPKGSEVIVPEANNDRALGAYAYPRGGKAVKTNKYLRFGFMFSATISVGSKNAAEPDFGADAAAKQ